MMDEFDELNENIAQLTIQIAVLKLENTYLKKVLHDTSKALQGVLDVLERIK